MRIKHFLKLNGENNQETWIILTRYNLASVPYNILYFISLPIYDF